MIRSMWYQKCCFRTFLIQKTKKLNIFFLSLTFFNFINRHTHVTLKIYHLKSVIMQFSNEWWKSFYVFCSDQNDEMGKNLTRQFRIYIFFVFRILFLGVIKCDKLDWWLSYKSMSIIQVVIGWWLFFNVHLVPIHVISE